MSETAEVGERRQFPWVLVGLGILCLGSAVAIPIAVVQLKEKDSLYGDVLFPFVLIVGLIALLSAIAMLVFVLKSLGLDDSRYALGMPDGTIRAIIAVMLILLFAMLAAFLYIDLANGRESKVLNSVSQESLDAIPARELVSVVPVDGAPDRFIVTTRVDRSQASADLAKQLVTTVSTLVVAISAFYFGAQSVETARRGPPLSPQDAASGPSAPRSSGPATPATPPASGPTTLPSAPGPRRAARKPSE